MDENRKHQLKRVAAVGAIAGAIGLGGTLAAGPASAAPTHPATASALTDLTPSVLFGPDLPNGTCCQGATNNVCC